MTALARPALIRAQTVSSPIRIGEISTYAADPAFSGPYRKGLEMGVAQANDVGGVFDRKIELVSRDDGGKPEEAVRVAGELLNEDKVDLLAGGSSSDTGLALSAFALQAKKLYVAGLPMSDALTWSKGNRYTYRVRPCTYMQTAMLANVAVTLPANTYVTVAPNDADGQTAVQAFKQLVAAKRPDITFIGGQFPTPGKIDPAAVVSALGQPAPDAIFNALLGPDLPGFVREGDARGLFAKRTVFSLRTGEPEFLDQLGAQTPAGWVVTGYPWSLSDEPSNKQFVLDYMLRYHEPPGMGSVIGSALMSAIVSGMLKSGSANTEAMADGFADSAFTTPFGICNFRAIDHQSTLGSYVGRLAKQNGRGGMVDWRYIDGASVLPSDADIRQLRPG